MVSLHSHGESSDSQNIYQELSSVNRQAFTDSCSFHTRRGTVQGKRRRDAHRPCPAEGAVVRGRAGGDVKVVESGPATRGRVHRAWQWGSIPVAPQARGQCAAKPTIKNKRLTCGVCCFLQGAYSPGPESKPPRRCHRTQSGKETCGTGSLSGAAASRPQHPAGPRPSLPRDTWRMEAEPWHPGQGKGPRDAIKTAGSFFNASSGLSFHEPSTHPVLRWHLS